MRLDHYKRLWSHDTFFRKLYAQNQIDGWEEKKKKNNDFSKIPPLNWSPLKLWAVDIIR